MVACVEDYHLFVPWCRRSVILKRVGDSYMEAELDVGFQVFKASGNKGGQLSLWAPHPPARLRLASVERGAQCVRACYVCASACVSQERYVSLVSLEMPSAQRPGAVASTVRDSALFRHLKSTWRIAPGPTPGTTWVRPSAPHRPQFSEQHRQFAAHVRYVPRKCTSPLM